MNQENENTIKSVLPKVNNTIPRAYSIICAATFLILGFIGYMLVTYEKRMHEKFLTEGLLMNYGEPLEVIYNERGSQKTFTHVIILKNSKDMKKRFFFNNKECILNTLKLGSKVNVSYYKMPNKNAQIEYVPTDCSTVSKVD